MATKQQLAAELFCHTGVAIRELGTPGFYHQGVVQESVRQFQIKWSQIFPLIRNDPGYHIPLQGKGYVTRPYTDKYAYQAGSTETGVPNIKGQWGAATSICMDTFVEAAFKYLNIAPPYYTEYGTKRILPWKAVKVAEWYAQYHNVIDQMCPKGVPDSPSAPDPVIAPIQPTVIPSAPSAPNLLQTIAQNVRWECTSGYPNVFRNVASQKLAWVTDAVASAFRNNPEWAFVKRQESCKPAVDPGLLQTIAQNVRWVCTKGFPNVFRNVASQKLAWVTDTAEAAFRKNPEWDFVKKQYSCGPVALVTPFEKDNTKIIAGVGLALAGGGAIYWFFLRKRKKRK